MFIMHIHLFVKQVCDIAVNWAGGLHHAKKCEVSVHSPCMCTLLSPQNRSLYLKNTCKYAFLIGNRILLFFLRNVS